MPLLPQPCERSQRFTAHELQDACARLACGPRERVQPGRLRPRGLAARRAGDRRRKVDLQLLATADRPRRRADRVRQRLQGNRGSARLQPDPAGVAASQACIRRAIDVGVDDRDGARTKQGERPDPLSANPAGEAGAVPKAELRLDLHEASIVGAAPAATSAARRNALIVASTMLAVPAPGALSMRSTSSRSVLASSRSMMPARSAATPCRACVSSISRAWSSASAACWAGTRSASSIPAATASAGTSRSRRPAARQRRDGEREARVAHQPRLEKARLVLDRVRPADRVEDQRFAPLHGPDDRRFDHLRRHPVRIAGAR